MKQFLRNTLINVSAIGVTGLVGLMLVPIIVSAYGLESLGLIVLARILLPTSVLGLLDLGTAEATTRFVASSAAEGGRGKAAHSLIASLAIVLPIAACIAVTGGLAATWVTESVLGISDKHTPLMQGVVMWTCLAAVVTFPGMVCEGALRG
ncbi:MAG: hypothetical protein ACREDZ_16410, partial [Kiloniellales bacterium]